MYTPCKFTVPDIFLALVPVPSGSLGDLGLPIKFINLKFPVPSGSLAEDSDVYAIQIHHSKYPDRYLESAEPQGPLRETLREHEI
jgi:hypothetical protein